MVKKDDILIVRVTEELVAKAVEYAEKSLQYTYNRMGLANYYDRVRNIVSGVVMEGAFKKLLDYNNIKYDLLGNTHWTKKDRYDVGVDGHRYDAKGFFIKEPDKIKSIEKDKSWLLDCSALVPADQVASRNLEEDDIYIFPFMTGRVIRNIDDVYDLFEKGQHNYLLHCFWDYSWTKNEEWNSLGKLILESKMREKILVRLGGQGEDKELLIEKIALIPMKVHKTDREFFTVLFVQTCGIPSGDLNIKSIKIKNPEKITVRDWGNIWLYDALVYFPGFMTKGEFRNKSKKIPRFYKKCKQYGETKTENRMLLVNELNSIKELLPKKCEMFVP